MDIDKIKEIMSGSAGNPWETTKKPLDSETVKKIYEKESRKIDLRVMISYFLVSLQTEALTMVRQLFR